MAPFVRRSLAALLVVAGLLATGCHGPSPAVRNPGSSPPWRAAVGPALGQVASASVPVVAGGPTGYLLFGEAPRESSATASVEAVNPRWVQALDSDGVPRGAPVPDGAGRAAAAARGRDVLVGEVQGAGPAFRRVGWDGQPLGAWHAMPDARYASVPALAWDGAEYVALVGLPGPNNVLALVRTVVAGQRLEPDGTPAGERFPVVPHSQITQYAVGSAGSPGAGFQVVWRADLGDEGGATVLLAQRIDAHGRPLSERHVVSGATLFQQAPAVAGDASGTAVAYYGVARDAGRLVSGVWVQGFDRQGRPFPGPVRVSEGDGAGSPAIASDGRGFLVAWPEPPAAASASSRAVRLRARFLDARARPLPGPPRDVAMVADLDQTPAVASDRHRYLVAWNGGVRAAVAVLAPPAEASGSAVATPSAVATR